MFGGFWQLDRTTSVWKAGSSSLYVEKIIDFEKNSAQKFNLGENQTSTRDIFLANKTFFYIRFEPNHEPFVQFSGSIGLAVESVCSETLHA